jgi:hypothetical protein
MLKEVVISQLEVLFQHSPEWPEEMYENLSNEGHSLSQEKQHLTENLI